jgi:hypothetical protein
MYVFILIALSYRKGLLGFSIRFCIIKGIYPLDLPLLSERMAINSVFIDFHLVYLTYWEENIFCAKFVGFLYVRVAQLSGKIENIARWDRLNSKFKIFGKFTLNVFLSHRSLTLIPLSGVGTACFSSMIKIWQLFLWPTACLTSTLLGNGLDTNDSTVDYTARTNGLTCLRNHGGAQDNKFWSPFRWHCLVSVIARRPHWPQGHRVPKKIKSSVFKELSLSKAIILSPSFYIFKMAIFIGQVNNNK